MNFFKDLSGGLARFIYAWIVPSATTVALFALLVLPDLSGTAPSFVDAVTGSSSQTIAALSVAVLLLSVLFAYASLPIYRLLEGYTLPMWIARPLQRRRLREWYQLQAKVRATTPNSARYQLDLERLTEYPSTEELIRPTRLGNAFTALEDYGPDRFGLDQQTFWYELQSVASPALRTDTEDTRAGIDFFISAVAHLSLLAVCAGVVAVVTRGLGAALTCLVAVLLVPLAYRQAVVNVKEYRYAVQALIHMGRKEVAEKLGYRLPDTFEQERWMWEQFHQLVGHGNTGHLMARMDDLRGPRPDRASGRKSQRRRRCRGRLL
jgi:hypothetical protein